MSDRTDRLDWLLTLLKRAAVDLPAESFYPNKTWLNGRTTFTFKFHWPTVALTQWVTHRHTDSQNSHTRYGQYRTVTHISLELVLKAACKLFSLSARYTHIEPGLKIYKHCNYLTKQSKPAQKLPDRPNRFWTDKTFKKWLEMIENQRKNNSNYTEKVCD